ncbi:MAG: hypothetical protein HOW73_39830 [Polyangiaceae bacterium]|nr:hypothetical protein [Polyangiaceae bacterium]
MHTWAPMEISREAVELIIAWEIAGGDYSAARSVYDRRYTHPHWPGNAASGLTIGVGYDLRHQTEHYERDWKSRLSAIQKPKDAYDRLRGYLGKSGTNAAVEKTSDIAIPWADALAVYRIDVLPRFITSTENTFPGVEGMHPHVRGALTSLVYNCGPGTKGDDKILKKQAFDAIRVAVADKNVRGVADGILAMKLYHEPNTRVREGLYRRREAEAALALQGEVR